MAKRKYYGSLKRKLSEYNRVKTKYNTHVRNKRQRCHLITNKQDHSKLANLYKPFIKNYSDIQLSDIDIITLGKGLKFIPTPKQPHRSKLINDYHRYARRMRVSYIMHNKSKKLSPFRPKSKWEPRDSENNKLEAYLELTKHEICHARYNRPEPNISKSERNALNKLQKNTNIVIKKPDKSRGICIMSDFQYRKVGFNHLSSHHYEHIPFDKTHETATKVHNSLINMYHLKQIDENTLDYLDPQNYEIRTSHMYFLPKVHKPPPPNLPFHARPIVSGTNGPTTKISEFCDYFLRPIASKQSTYVKDTTDIINKIEANSYPQNIILATIDVTAMYCNIIQKEAIEIACKAYEKSNITYDMKKPDTDCIKNMLELILNNNTFCFGDLYYKQKVGLAMGSPVSPSLANIAMHPLELEFLNTTNKIENYWRYLDDGIILFSGTKPELEELIKQLNKMHETIKFTATISDSEINYLDITIFKGKRFKESGILDIKIYVKECETFMYLNPTSTHPQATFSGFIKGEFLRYARNCNNEKDFIQHSNLFSSKLQNRGYTAEQIREIRNTVSHTDRPNLLKPKNTDENNATPFPLVFTTEYTSHLKSPTIKKALTKYWSKIEMDEKLKAIFPEPPLIAFRRTKNIQNIVVRAKLPPDEDLNILIDLMNE